MARARAGGTCPRVLTVTAGTGISLVGSRTEEHKVAFLRGEVPRYLPYWTSNSGDG